MNQASDAASAKNDQWDRRLYKAVNKDPILPEVFKSLRSRILHPLDGGKVPRTIMVTSARPGEGKTFITANLGISLASGIDQHALLVDCDLRKPSLAKMFGLPGVNGLSNYLRGQATLPELLSKTSVEKLSVLTSGVVPRNPAELLSSARMQAMVVELSSRYDDRIIIFDSPPMLVAAEASVLAGQVDAIILVVRQHGAGKGEISKLIELIGDERILGIVFNDHTTNLFEKTFIKDSSYYYRGYP